MHIAFFFQQFQRQNSDLGTEWKKLQAKPVEADLNPH